MAETHVICFYRKIDIRESGEEDVLWAAVFNRFSSVVGTLVVCTDDIVKSGLDFDFVPDVITPESDDIILAVVTPADTVVVTGGYWSQNMPVALSTTKWNTQGVKLSLMYIFAKYDLT